MFSILFFRFFQHYFLLIFPRMNKYILPKTNAFGSVCNVRPTSNDTVSVITSLLVATAAGRSQASSAKESSSQNSQLIGIRFIREDSATVSELHKSVVDYGIRSFHL